MPDNDVNSQLNIFLHFEFAETSEHEIYAVSAGSVMNLSLWVIHSPAFVKFYHEKLQIVFDECGEATRASAPINMHNLRRRITFESPRFPLHARSNLIFQRKYWTRKLPCSLISQLDISEIVKTFLALLLTQLWTRNLIKFSKSIFHGVGGDFSTSNYWT